MTFDAALGVLSGLRLENGDPWGERATDWQWADARALLNPEPPNRHYLTRPRGASKTSDLAGIAIAALLEQLPANARAYAFAADAQQAALLLDAAAGFVGRTPGLAGALSMETYRVVVRSSGASLTVMASDAASAWGLRPSFVVVDEFSRWPETRNPRELFRALLTAVPKVRGCRFVIITSAGDPGHMSHRVLAEARRSDRWRVNEVAGPTPWVDSAELAADRSMLPDSEYRRLHLNEWAASEDKLTRIEDIEACATLPGALDAVPGVGYCVALDLGLVKDRTALVVCHSELFGPKSSASTEPEPVEDAQRIPPNFVGDGRDLCRVMRLPTRRKRGWSGREDVPRHVIVDRLECWQGTRANPVRLNDVEAWLLHAARTYNDATVYLDPWQAAGAAQRLRARRLRVIEATFTATSNSRRAVLLHNLIRDHRLAIPQDAALVDELLNVRLRQTQPGVFRLDHDANAHDDRAVVIALGAEYLLETAHEYERKAGWSTW